MRYFDKERHRLVYINQQATSTFWDAQWQAENGRETKALASKNTYVSKLTQKYLAPEDGPILEGGCGNGQHVTALTHNGYRCIGVDYAPRTVLTINRTSPGLQVYLGDVRNLSFTSNYFMGYWSIGVIEHFWDGYEAIAQEMVRVIQPGGYLFLTFPYMSPFRKLKAKLGFYNRRSDFQGQPADFYQFALNHHAVIQKFQELGFQLVDTKSLDGLKGFKDEIGAFKPVLQKFYNYRGRSVLIRGSRKILTEMLAGFFGHAILLVLKRVNTL